MNPTKATTRRASLKALAGGLGAVAAQPWLSHGATPGAPTAAKAPQYPGRAKRVIFLFMNGGPSHMDTFDYKPQLQKDHGKKVNDDKEELFGSPWAFQRRGQSGLWVSELFPELAKRADDLLVVRSMTTDSSAHPQAMPQLHTGSFQFTRPSMGSWILYGIGAEAKALPGFVAVNPSRIFGGPANYGSAFLPSVYQGARIGWEGGNVLRESFRNIASSRIPLELQGRQIELAQRMAKQSADSEAVAAAEALELGARMRDVAPEVMDLRSETEETQNLYGLNEDSTKRFGAQCLLARRLIEAGVRFVELSHGGWDHHQGIKNGLERKCRETDRPIAALLTDLKRRGLLDETLVIWGGEFGRKPELEFGSGRGHNATGFTFWLAGGGVTPGVAYGETDEYGRKAVSNPVHVHDLHATMLHLLGMDHEALTYRYGGRDFRLTDVHGRIIHDWVA